MILDQSRTVDPRDNLEKARRRELVEFARAKGLDEVTEQMPAPLIRNLLRGRGMTQIAIPHRTIGAMAQEKTFPLGEMPVPAAPPTRANVEINADDDLMRQFLSEQGHQPAPPAAAPATTSPADKMGFNELQKFCTANNIPRGRKENTESLREKVKAFQNG